MKLTIERAAFLKALGHVQSVVERRTTIPILSNVLLRAEPGRLALSATDMDLEIIERVPARIEREGRTTAPAHTLYDIVRKLRDGAQIEIETSGERNAIVLRSGRSTFTLACLPPEDYPLMASGELPYNFSLSAIELRTLIDRTRFAISTEETRYYLNGIYLHATDSAGKAMLRAVATDGHRLAQVELPLPSGAKGMPGVIVPRKTVLELAKLVEDADGEVRLDQNVVRELNGAFNRHECVIRRRPNESCGQCVFDALMRNVLGRHHHEIPLDQLKSLVFAEDAGFHHPVDIIHGERPPRQTVGCPSHCDVHAGAPIVVLFLNWDRYSDDRPSRAYNRAF